MLLTILSYMHVLCRRADLVKKSTFLGTIILIFFACALRHSRVMTGYYVTLKYHAKPRTVAWKVFATLKWLFYLILPCKQHNCTSGTYSIEIIIAQKSQRSIFKFVKDQWNASHDSLIHACSLSASWFGEKKKHFSRYNHFIFFACALRHCKVMTGYYVTLKYHAKPRTIAWKVFATLKWLDSTKFCLANIIIGLQALIPSRYLPEVMKTGK